MEIGGKQQQYEQARLNQIIQDYATQQQYPFIQLGTLSNMLRGLPMQASTTQMYQAQPSLLQQGVGLAGAGANLYQAFGDKRAEGGAIKEMASGGIATGADPYKLPGMMKKLSDDQLGKKMGGDTDPETLGIAQAEKQRRDQVRAGAPKMMASGGAVAFKEGGIKDTTKNPFADPKEVKPEDKEVKPAPKAAAPKAAASAASATPYQDKYREALTGFAPPPELEKTRANIKELEDRVAAGVTGELDRQQAAYAKLGIDPVKMFEEERARRQEEMKMTREDARKSEHLRWAQMFAKFGSTPGPSLRAALIAINDTVPDLLDDQAKTSAVQREANKALNDLNRAEFLEKKGRVDEALKSHNAAAEKAATLSANLGEMLYKAQVDKLQVTGRLAGEEMGARARIEAERIQAASRQSSDQRAEKENRRREDAQTVNAQKALENFEKNKARIDKQKDAERKVAALASKPDNPQYIQAKRDLEALQVEKQEFINNLPLRYPLARLGDLAGPDKQPEAPRNADSTLQPGQIVDGYKFKGGDPNDKNNWAKN
jgi:hypothetical protein